ncbi:MAG: hypothetical protein ACXVK3_01300 [Candidatus Angelobacter sp.]
MKVLIVAELLSLHITVVIKMNTNKVVLFLVSFGYISIIFATGHVPYGDDRDGFDKSSGSKYFSNPDQHIHFFSRVFSAEDQGLNGDF